MSASPPTIPTETAATEPVSAFERPNRSSARPAAIHAPAIPGGPLAERLEVAARAQRTSDQALDLPRPPVRPAARDGARRPFARRGGKHRVLGRHPPASLPVEPARYALFDSCRAKDECLPLPEEHGAVRLLGEV